MSKQKQIVTKEGYAKIISEIEERENITRVKIADDIEKARQQGDLSENAAYKSAIEAKEFNENKISLLKEQLTNSEVIQESRGATVGIGKVVRVVNLTNNIETEYTIVGHNEADPTSHKISLDSPIGISLVGKKVGDIVIVNTPGGEIRFNIKSVN